MVAGKNINSKLAEYFCQQPLISRQPLQFTKQTAKRMLWLLNTECGNTFSVLLKACPNLDPGLLSLFWSHTFIPPAVHQSTGEKAIL